MTTAAAHAEPRRRPWRPCSDDRGGRRQRRRPEVAAGRQAPGRGRLRTSRSRPPAAQTGGTRRLGRARRPPAEQSRRAPPAWPAILPVVIVALVVAAIVAIAGSLVSQRIAEQQAVHDVAVMTDDLAAASVAAGPDRRDAHAIRPRRGASLDPLVRRWLSGAATLVRVKLWTPAGPSLYSDEPRLIGGTFALDDGSPRGTAAARTPTRTSATCGARRTGSSAATASCSRCTGRCGRRAGTAAVRDVLPVRHGEPAQPQLWRGFAGIMLSSSCWPSCCCSVRRAGCCGPRTAGRAEQEDLMRRAVDASDEERRRIAATLHDGVVQQLAAASFIAAGQAAAGRCRTGRPGAGGGPAIGGRDRPRRRGRAALAARRHLPAQPARRRTGERAARPGRAARPATARAVEADIDDEVADASGAAAGGDVPDRAGGAAQRGAARRGRAHHAAPGRRTRTGGPVLEIEDDGAASTPRSWPAGGRGPLRPAADGGRRTARRRLARPAQLARARARVVRYEASAP